MILKEKDYPFYSLDKNYCENHEQKIFKVSTFLKRAKWIIYLSLHQKMWPGY